MADRIMLLRDGKVEKIGKKDEMLDNLMGIQATKGCLDKHQIKAD